MNNDFLNRIKKNVSIKLYTTLKMPATAQYFIEAHSREDLIKAKKYSLEKKVSLLILGGGSNTAILKDQIGGLVVRNFYTKKEILLEDDDYTQILVSSGYPVSRLVTETINSGLGGFEYHFGLPGTVGGAVYMNSKWTKPVNYFGENLVYAYLVDSQGKEKKVDREYFNFAYDHSTLQETGGILLDAVFKLKKEAKDELWKKAKEALEYRKKTQPFGVASSGCIFRNIDGKSAGQMIDRVGLKGFKVGDFIVSPIHANFVINQKEGRPEDFKKLLNSIKTKIKTKYGLDLKEEVVLIK